MHIWLSLKLIPHNEAPKWHRQENNNKHINKYLGNYNTSLTLMMIKFTRKHFLNSISSQFFFCVAIALMHNNFPD